MLYVIYRIAAILLIIGICILIFRKKCLLLFRTKALSITTVLFVIVLFYTSLYLPIEENWVRFDTPEEAFEYTYFNKKILQVIEDEECAFIVYEDSNMGVMYISLDKEDGQWKMHNAYSAYSINLKPLGYESIIYVTNSDCSKTLIIIEEYFLKTNQGRKIIEDNLNSEFKCFHTLRESTGQYTVFTYTVIEANIDNYELRLDGEIVEWD